MEQITTMGIDLAKSVFSLYGVDGAGHVVLRRTVGRDQLVEVLSGFPIAPLEHAIWAENGPAKHLYYPGPEHLMPAIQYVASVRPRSCHYRYSRDGTANIFSTIDVGTSKS